MSVKSCDEWGISCTFGPSLLSSVISVSKVSVTSSFACEINNFKCKNNCCAILSFSEKVMNKLSGYSFLQTIDNSSTMLLWESDLNKAL